MKKYLSVLASAALLSGLGAQWVYAGTQDPRVQQREQNQEKRLEQGVQSGALTPHEAGKLEAQQAKIQQDEARMKADGNLTPAERAKLTREQNRASRNLYRKKHNLRKVE